MDTNKARARELTDQQRWNEAVAAYRSALQSAPDEADLHYELAWVLRRAGDFRAALVHYGKAIELGIARPEVVYLNCAVIYSDDLRDQPQAQRQLEMALAARPDYPPALLNLGNLHEDMGDRPSAMACYRALLRTDRVSPVTPALRLQAMARLLRLAPVTDVNDPLLLAVRAQAISAPVAANEVHADLYFALGDALERLERYPDAFMAFQLGNRWASLQGPSYDPRAREAFVDALIASSAHKVAAPVGPHPPLIPVFVLGLFRSGSTLIEQVLSAHSKIHGAGELAFFPRLMAERLLGRPQSVSLLSSAELSDIRQQYLEHLSELADRPESTVYCIDKRPDNFELLPLIKAVFPEAKIIHTLRQPVDNALSIYQQHLDQRVAAYSSDLSSIAHYMGQYQRWITIARERYAGDFHDFDYDAFVHHPETSLEALFRFLGLEFEPACLRFHEQRRSVKTASVWQVRKPLYSASSGRWRHYQQPLRELRELLARFGVDPDRQVPGPHS